MTSVYDVLRAQAARLRAIDPSIADVVEHVAADFKAALEDDDHVIERDDHFVLTNDLGQALAQIPANDPRYSETRDILARLNTAVRQGASAEKKKFQAYVPTFDTNNVVHMDVVGAPVSLGSHIFTNGTFATLMPASRMDELFPGRFTRAPMPAGTGTLDDKPSDYLFSDRPLLDRSRPTTVGKVYEEVKREMMLQGAVSVGVVGSSGGTSRPTVGLMLGREDVPTETVSAHLPEFMGGRDSEVSGVRVMWLLARELQQRGVLDKNTVDGWIARGKDPKARAQAAQEIARYCDGLQLSAYDRFRRSFAKDGADGGLAYVLEHGIMALSHNAQGRQTLPDYVSERGLVRTPSGPAMLVYDAPLPEKTVQSHHEVYPDKNAYVFGVDRLDMHIVEGTQLTAPAPRAQPAVSIPSLNDIATLKTNIAKVAKAAHGDRKQARDQQQQIVGVLSEIGPALANQQQALRDVGIQLMRADQRQSWSGRNFWSSREVSDLEKRRDTLQAWVDKAQDLESTSRLLLGTIAPASERVSPDELSAQVQRASSAINISDAAGWRDQVANLVRVQDGVRTEYAVSQMSAIANASDAERFASTTRFYQRWGWLDRMTGESDNGWLYRATQGANAGANKRLEALDQVQATGENQVTMAIDRLLVSENPVSQRGGTYQENRAGYVTVHPAYKALVSTFETAEAASRALSNTSAAITYRNVLAANEPSTTTEEERCDSKGNCTTTTVTNPAHVFWAIQYTAAVASVAYWSSQSEKRVNELNKQRPILQQELGRAGFVDYFHGRVDDSIDWWFGNWMRIGWWSYDSSQVDDMQSQVDRLVGNLHGISKQIAPIHNGLEAKLSDARRARRDGLRAAKS